MNEKKSTFKVLFYLKKKAERADGKVPVMLRMTVDGEIAQKSAKLFVTPRTVGFVRRESIGKECRSN